jgi:hypothetical protein
LLIAGCQRRKIGLHAMCTAERAGLPVARMKPRVIVAGLLLFVLGACSADLSLNNVTFKPETMLGTQPAWMNFSGSQAADLLTADGQCSAGPEQGSATAGGIALHMTECEVVRRAGPVEKFEFGTDTRGQRLLVLTYLHGAVPGIYRFTAGRLTEIDRAPVAEPAESRQKPRATGKKPAGS